MWIKNVPFKRDITNLTLYAVNFCGVFIYPEQACNAFVRYGWVIYSTYGVLYMCGLSIVDMVVNDYDYLVNISITINIGACLVCCLQVPIVMYVKKVLITLIELIDSGFYTYTDDHKLQVEAYSAEENLRKEKRLSVMIFSFYMLFTWPPLVVALTLRKNHENTPFDLVYVAWPLFGIATNTQFFFSFVLQEISTVPMFTTYMSKCLIIINVSKEFEYQCEKLKYALRTLSDRVSKKTVLEGSHKLDKDTVHRFVICDETEYLRKLAECTKHYQQFQKCMDLFSIWFSLIYSCELIYGVGSFALIGYVLISGTGNRAADFKYICLLCLFGGLLCFECFRGESILTMEDQVWEEIYNLPWYDQRPRVRKAIQMLLHEAMPKRKLRGLKLWPATVETFATIIRSSYSYLNLLSKTV